MITANNLNDVIEFDSPFTVFPGNNIIAPIDVYAPSVEHDDDFDILIDGVNPIDSEWQPFSTGYTGQYGYNGAVMHASEILSGALAADILTTPGTYVVCAVEVYCENGECYMSFDDVDSETEAKQLRMSVGCDCDPAGWTVLRLRNS